MTFRSKCKRDKSVVFFKVPTRPFFSLELEIALSELCALASTGCLQATICPRCFLGSVNKEIDQRIILMFLAPTA
ncbi:TPA: hypothetical protein DDW35_03990, partial [Candidatus Sumerlaeota bacterium]|nr:hypothetical protein [Candidatus Sumerlaeota bacterium]